MKSRQFSSFRLVTTAALCLLLVPAVGFSDDIPEDGPVGFYKEPEKPPPPWVELATDFPTYPDDVNRLIRINVSATGMRYKVYLDPASLTTGDDRVVRFTSVLISSSGIWNVNYEGLHCGERQYRRFAYGSNGKWFPMNDSPWQPVVGRGIYKYRKLLYEGYLCDSAAEYRDADAIARRLRNTNTIINDD